MIASRSLILLAVLGLGCSGKVSPEPYRFSGVGQEPGWSLEIDSIIRFSYDYAQRTVSVPTPEPTSDATGVRVWKAKNDTTDLQVVVAETACEDAMSGKPYPSTVTVTLNGQVYRGCGGVTGTPTPPPRP